MHPHHRKCILPARGGTTSRLTRSALNGRPRRRCLAIICSSEVILVRSGGGGKLFLNLNIVQNFSQDNKRIIATAENFESHDLTWKRAFCWLRFVRSRRSVNQGSNYFLLMSLGRARLAGWSRRKSSEATDESSGSTTEMRWRVGFAKNDFRYGTTKCLDDGLLRRQLSRKSSNLLPLFASLDRVVGVCASYELLNLELDSRDVNIW